MLEPAAFAICPELAGLHEAIRQMGVPHVRMTGSGSAMFALFDQYQRAQSWQQRIRHELDVATRVVRSLADGHASGGQNNGNHRGQGQTGR